MDFLTKPAWLKPSAAIAVNLAIVLSVLQPVLIFPTPAEAATTIFSDGFESGNFSNWTVADSPKWEINNATTTVVHSGIRRAEVKGNTNPGKDELKKATSTVGYESLVLSYWYRADSIDASDDDTVEVQYTDDGSNWNNLFTIDGDDDDSDWHQKTHPLPESVENNPNFAFRFTASLDEGNDSVKIDDVSLVGDAVDNEDEDQDEEENNDDNEEDEGSFIFGRKYDDKNGNGVRDEGEEGLGGVTIKLYEGGEVASTTATTWDGYFTFSDLEADEYKVCEEVPTGWHQTDPNADGGSSWLAEGRKKCANGTWGYEIEVNENAEIYSVDFGNAKGGLLMGRKYRDGNHNGERDEEELGLGNWTIRLYQDDEKIDEVETAWDGYFTFAGLEPGDYTICEVNPDNDENWQQTDPTEEGGSSWRAEGRVWCEEENTWGYQVEGLNWGDEWYSYDFGNVPGAMLSGAKYWDANANGERDGAFPTEEDGEKGVTNYPIKLYKINDEEEWQLVDTTYTDPDLWAKGMYYFKGVEPGEYYICEELPVVGEWVQTDPTAEGGSSWRAEGRVECPDGTWGYATGPVEWGDEQWSFDFGNYKAAAIRVTKVANPDQGTFNFTLTGPNDYEESESTNGSTESPLAFLNLLPGLYQLTEEMPADWFVSQDPYCTDGEISDIDPDEINLTSGLNIHCYFNNSQFGLITGRKFEDKDADGVSEAEEPGLAGWTINLYQPGEGEDGLADAGSTLTAPDGSFSFGNLLPGTYYVCEESQGGWTQSTPGSGFNCPNEGTIGHEIVVAEGGSFTANFGNWQAGGISGYKWHDYNHDGFKDEDEPKLSGWTIYLDENGNETLDGEDDSTTTNEDGYYSFSGLNAGTTYEVREVLQGDWVQTYPAGGSHSVVVLSGETATANFGNHEGEIPVPDTEPPVTVINAPGPESFWEGFIRIMGTTTDNIGVASATLSFANYIVDEDNDNLGECGSYSEIITLGNPGWDAIFDWIYDWFPSEDGDYCIKANGIDTSGNEEHTAVVFPVKFKKVATTTPPVVEEEEEEGGGGGGGGSKKKTSTTTDEFAGGVGGSEEGGTGTTTPPGVLGNLALLTLPENLIYTGTTTGTTTDLGTSTEEVLDQSGLLAALGNLPFSWWWLLLLILILLAGYAGYRYWQRRHANQ